ncbi:hypothetical protein [Burkholderia dolosa]|uniref:hypothetical protein n=2 Tax=Burkholderia dolosa TaxID=152500 RepID=UPI001B8E995C|nr:hypothetical protein [Burkholderia dolosa]MBR8060796.1 hypothetical protein [Burkholderia dolosa]
MTSANRHPRRWHAVANTAPIVSISPPSRDRRADPVPAYGLHCRIPDWLIDEPAVCALLRQPTAHRCSQYRKRRAMRYSTDDRERRRRTAPARVAGIRIFLFQKCIATIVAHGRRSLSVAMQCGTARSNRAAGPARRACANECFKPERCVGNVLRCAHRATPRSAFDARRMTIESRYEGARQASGAADIATFTRLDLSRHSIRN